MTIVVEAMAQDLKAHRPQGGRAVGAPARPGVVRAGAGCPRGAAGEPGATGREMAAMEPNWRRPDPFGFPMARGGVRSPGIGRSPPIRLGRACPTRHRLARLSGHLTASRPCLDGWSRRRAETR